MGVGSYVLTELVAFNDFELVRVISSVFSGNSRSYALFSSARTEAGALVRCSVDSDP